MDKTDISAKLKQLLEEECEIVVPTADAQLDIDSFNMMLIITYVDNEMGVVLDMDQLNFDAFTSLDILTEMVAHEIKAA